MMKKRSLLCLLLALCLLLMSLAPFAAAAAPANAVAKMYLCYRWSGVPSLGHTWVYIENLSEETLQVGAYRLPPNQGVSLGNFGLTRNDGNGTYYNVEAYCGNHYPLSGMCSNSTYLTRSQLSSVSNSILSVNFWFPLVSNCTDFAVRVWNAGGGAFHIPIIFPVLTKLQIQMHGDEGFVKMYSPTKDQVKKQHGSGSGATLTTCSDGTISKQIG